MRGDPVLATVRLPKGTNGYRVPIVMIVHGGVHYMRGNSKPYFSLTCDTHRVGFPNQCQGGGAAHDLILKHLPKFKDLADLHLCDIDGSPMHDVSNAWYDLAGSLPGGAGEKYHVGNSERHCPITPDPKTPWKDTEYRRPTPLECVAIFANHVRISEELAMAVRDSVCRAALQGVPVPVHTSEDRAIAADAADNIGLHDLADTLRNPLRLVPYDWNAGKEWLRSWIEEQRPRWKEEAEACIKNHNLRVYGDPWPTPVEAAS